MKCRFCNSDRSSKSLDEQAADMMKRVEANDAASMCVLADSYHHGSNGLQRDEERAKDLYTRAAELGFSMAHNNLGNIYHEWGYLKKAKFHYFSFFESPPSS